MNQHRQGLIKTVFQLLDDEALGTVSIKKLREVFDASKHPDVVRKQKSEEDVFTEFLDSFEECYYYLVLLAV